jgi:hypothetical protein
VVRSPRIWRSQLSPWIARLDGSAEALRHVLDVELALRIDSVRQTVARVHGALSRPELTASTEALTLRLEAEHFAHTPALPA